MHLNITTRKEESLHYADKSSIDCQELLTLYKIKYKDQGIYFQYGEIDQVQGWILHVSSIRIQFIPLIETIVPVLIDLEIPFKVAKDRNIAKFLLDGSLGYSQLGKLICVYPPVSKLLVITQKLIELTQNFKGPAIPTDAFLGGTLYTRYGSYNPIVKLQDNGNIEKYIYNSTGKLELDYYFIPFRIPDKCEWPFSKFAQPPILLTKKLWNEKYKPLVVIKPDCKGQVIKGLYFKNIFTIKPCLIKEAVKNMWADEFERDIVDRILWQHELYQDLEGHILTPKIFDLFQQEGNTYLVMEFINGDSIESKVSKIYNGNSWHCLSLKQKLLIIEYLLKILQSIEKVHSKEYIHRDITPSNFIIDKKGNIFLIDMELSYSINKQKPNPAFKQGTPGYMSPEQIERQTPTVKEDIYAIGALMIFFFTGLSPLKIDSFLEQETIDHINFLTRNDILTSLISRCLSSNPKKRPSLLKIKNTIEDFFKELELNKTPSVKLKRENNYTLDRINSIIETAIIGLSDPELLSFDNVWLSTKKQPDVIGTQSTERTPQVNLYTGMTGILHMLAVAKQFGYNIASCLPSYRESWDYIITNVFTPAAIVSDGLYNGKAGIALAITSGINSGLLVKDIYKHHLQSCFSGNLLPTLELASGVAGQGIALLKCSSHLNSEFYLSTLQSYIYRILKQQKKDGSWINYRENSRKKDNVLGLAYGTAGIICFLISAAKDTNDARVILSIEKGLNWLYKLGHKKRGLFWWTTSTKSKSIDSWSYNTGIPGVVSTFIKGYNLLANPLYKQVAENALRCMPEEPIHYEFTQADGLSGLGEVYLEASQAFSSEEWQLKTDWIANLLQHCFIQKKELGGYWSVNIYPDFEPGLLTGTSGIIYFLMRYAQKNTIGHMLFGQ